MSDLAQELAEALKPEVGALFGVPGSGMSYQVITALQDRGINFYGTSHEAAAAIMAGAFGRQSGTVGCSIAIKGPGLANMLPGIASNHFEDCAALSIAEAIGPKTPPGRVHKRLDQHRLVDPLVKAYARPDDPAGVTVSRLLKQAKAETPGPVHLDLPTGHDPWFNINGAAVAPLVDPATRDQVLKPLAVSARPLVIVGSLARRSAWRGKLAELKVPVLTTLAAKGVLDERLPHAAGVFTGDGKALSPEQRLLAEADLVIGVGLRNTEILNPAAITRPLALVDVLGGDIATGFAASASYPFADADHIAELLGALTARSWGLDLVAEATDKLRTHLLAHPWLPAATFAELERQVPDATFVADTGSFCTVAEHRWRAGDPNGFLCSANGRYMGTGLPMAIGAALAGKGRPVICALGDGGARMYVAEIKLAVAHKLPVLFLFLADGRYGSIATAIPPARRRADVLDMPGPSWYEAVAALGCQSSKADDMASLASAVGRWRAGGPAFIEARFDPELYINMTEGVR